MQADQLIILCKGIMSDDRTEYYHAFENNVQKIVLAGEKKFMLFLHILK